MAHLGLRVRILLFFALLGLGGAAMFAAALWFAYGRLDPGAPLSAFVTAGLIGCLALWGLVVLVWLLFDENVAKPIERLAAGMRACAHAGVDSDLDLHAARYLGDLAPAATAVSGELSRSAMDTADAVASHTARLAAETRRLTALLSEIPMAMVLVGPDNHIVLYDAQAAEVLAQVAPPRLHAPILDYIDAGAWKKARTQLEKTGKEVEFSAKGAHGQFDFKARLKPLGQDGEGHTAGMLLLIEDSQALFSPTAARPVTYDFDLLSRPSPASIRDTPLRDLTYVVLDTETTGLLPHKDEIVQIGAVRVVNGRIVPGEVVDRLVNPARTIPPASTRVHGITDAMVAGAPEIGVAGAELHRFCSGAVLVAHNAPFDMAFLHRFGKGAGLAWDHPVVDTVLLSAVVYGTTQTHTLDALCDRLGVVIPERLRHTALGDAQATAEVLCKLIPMLAAQGYDTLGKLITQTSKHGRLLHDLNGGSGDKGA